MTEPTAGKVIVKQRRPDESGAAALATIARFHGLPLGLDDIRSLAGTESLRLDLMYLLFAARKLGFDVLPLEGDFEHLPEVPRPNIVTFGQAGDPEQAFMVVYEIDGDSAVIGNTATGGIERVGKEAFCEQWDGGAIQILPDQLRLSGVRKQIEDRHDPSVILQRAVGIQPLSPSRLLFVIAAAVIASLPALWRGPLLDKMTLAATGICFLLSLWSWFFSGICRACSKSSAIVGGLRLPQFGSGLYAALLLLALFFGPTTLSFRVGLFVASGAHLFLLGLLLKSKLLCWPCIAAAVSAFSASALSIMAAGGQHAAWALAALAAGFVLACLIIVPARKLHQSQLRAGTYALAAKVLTDGIEVAPGRVRVVVYTRKNCPSCSFYEIVLRPALEQDFGDVLSIEERDAGNEKVGTPLFVISGAMNLVAGDLAPENAHQRLTAAIETALDPNPSKFKTLGGFYLMGFTS